MSPGICSGGCIDADVALQAAQALEAGDMRRVRYGAGSPFIDLPLPCGGAIDLAILPDPDADALRRLRDLLAARRCASLTMKDDGALAVTSGMRPAPSSEEGTTFRYTPKLKLRIAGAAPIALALAALAPSERRCGRFVLPRRRRRRARRARGLTSVARLATPASLPDVKDDAWTAFVLMFHDTDWETPLLAQAARRSGLLRRRRRQPENPSATSVAARRRRRRPADIRRVRGPVGLVPSMRDASMLAVSVLAEIVDAYHAAKTATFGDTALLLLAAGASSRFGGRRQTHGDAERRAAPRRRRVAPLP